MSEPYLAEIRLMGFNFAPRGWAMCDGQILPIKRKITEIKIGRQGADKALGEKHLTRIGHSDSLRQFPSQISFIGDKTARHPDIINADCSQGPTLLFFR